MKPDFVFLGTDKFAAQVLARLATHNLVPTAAISTDTLGPPPPANVYIVASYGKILKREVLAQSRHGTLNIHPSLLPKHRGPSPLQTTILNGDKETGVSIMLLDEQVDHGPILAQAKIDVGERNFEMLRDALAILGADLLAEVLPKWIAGKITPIEQDHPAATYTKKMKKEDGLIDLTDDPNSNYRKFLAYHPWPGIYYFVNHAGRSLRVLITAAHLADGKFIIDRVKPEGRKEMDYASFLRGLRN